MNTGGDAEGDTLVSIEGVFGSNAGDQITGDAGNNGLFGRGGDDTLSGGDGNDYFRGDAGADVLTGGAGVNTYKYRGLGESLLANFDMITDSVVGRDRIDAPTATPVTEAVTAVTALDEAGIQGVLGDEFTFGSDTAATFTFGARTFLALNDSTAGFQAANDAVIEITGFSGDLSALTVI